MSGTFAVKICSFSDKQMSHFLEPHLYFWQVLMIDHFISGVWPFSTHFQKYEAKVVLFLFSLWVKSDLWPYQRCLNVFSVLPMYVFVVVPDVTVAL